MSNKSDLGRILGLVLFAGTAVSQLFVGTLWGQENCPKVPGLRTVTAKALASKAIRKVEPDLPGGFGRINANISVTVVVDPQGNVTCAHASSDTHPMLRNYCEDAARQWRFKPFHSKGKPVTVTGPVIFHIKR